jgi:hypothetical protein
MEVKKILVDLDILLDYRATTLRELNIDIPDNYTTRYVDSFKGVSNTQLHDLIDSNKRELLTKSKRTLIVPLIIDFSIDLITSSKYGGEEFVIEIDLWANGITLSDKEINYIVGGLELLLPNNITVKFLDVLTKDVESLSRYDAMFIYEGVDFVSRVSYMLEYEKTSLTNVLLFTPFLLEGMSTKVKINEQITEYEKAIAPYFNLKFIDIKHCNEKIDI